MRLAGVNIPKNKRVVIALTYVYGIGPKISANILKVAGIDENTRTKDLSVEQQDKLRAIVEKQHTTEGDLRREVMSNIKRLKDIKAYRGVRHSKHLPARGQKSRVNSRTARGNVRRTMGSGRKPSAQKT
ncbi:MAG: 30S ribosomal protein S13 [bacterium]